MGVISDSDKSSFVERIFNEDRSNPVLTFGVDHARQEIMSFHLTNSQARHVILHLQGLTQPPHRVFGPGGLRSLIHQLGFVQVDSIQWVERAQHMTLFARNQTYRPKQLKALIEDERALFENWTHDSSIIPVEFYPYWKHRFSRRQETLDKKFENWQGVGYRDHCASLLKRITDDGPLMSRHLERPKGSAKPEMWQWHDGKAALEYLWHTGQLCISGRQGFQKIYDLAQNGVPEPHYSNTVSHDAFIDWACRSALERLGFGSSGDIARYWDIISPAETKAWVENELASGTNTSLMEISVQGASSKSSKQFVARADIASVVENLPPMPKRIRALSPFDPVIRDRKRLEWLFGFEYRIEIYVPEAKRRWGYYVFPLLENDRLIGRIDMRADRIREALVVKRLWLEPKVKLSAARKERLEAELVRQSRLAGVTDVIWNDDALN